MPGKLAPIKPAQRKPQQRREDAETFEEMADSGRYGEEGTARLRQMAEYERRKADEEENSEPA